MEREDSSPLLTGQSGAALGSTELVNPQETIGLVHNSVRFE